MAILLNLVKSPSSSTQRCASFRLDEDAQAGMNNITNRRSLCATRWPSRANVLYTFKSAFTAVVTALEYSEKMGTPKSDTIVDH